MEHLQIVSVIVVLKCKDKFLLVKRDQRDESFPGKWQNLGGKVEVGERVEEALKREALEEVGLKVNQIPIFLQSYSWTKGNKNQMRLGLVFLVNLERRPKDYPITLSNELSVYKWITLDQAKKFNTNGLLVGKNSPTGTFAQLTIADSLTKGDLLRPTS